MTHNASFSRALHTCGYYLLLIVTFDHCFAEATGDVSLDNILKWNCGGHGLQTIIK